MVDHILLVYLFLHHNIPFPQHMSFLKDFDLIQPSGFLLAGTVLTSKILLWMAKHVINISPVSTSLGAVLFVKIYSPLNEFEYPLKM